MGQENGAAAPPKWKRHGGHIGIGTITDLGERFLKGHQRNPNFGSGLALEEDFTKFFSHYGGLKPGEQECVRQYVAGRIGTARRLTWRDVSGLSGPLKPSTNGDAQQAGRE